MRSRVASLSLSTVLVALPLLALGALAVACGDDPDASPGPDASDEPYDVCDTFTTTGAACAVVSEHVCFAQCRTGGCRCVAGPSGSGVWACTTDLTCYPDTGVPTEDAGERPDVQPIYDASPDADDGAPADAAAEADAT